MCHYWSDHSPKTTGMDDKSVPGALMFRDNDICRGPLSSCAKERPCASNGNGSITENMYIYIYIQKAEIHVCNVYIYVYIYNMG